MDFVISIERIGDWAHPAVHVNGYEWTKFQPEEWDHSRIMYTGKAEPAEMHTYMLKIEAPHTNLRQFAMEKVIWDGIEEDDRHWFTPVLTAGENDTYGWVLTRFYEELLPAKYATPAAVERIRDMAAKYSVGDWCDRQWKVRPGGEGIIHDYGVSWEPTLRQRSQESLAPVYGPCPPAPHTKIQEEPFQMICAADCWCRG